MSFFRLSTADRGLVARALAIVLLVRLALWTVPSRHVVRFVAARVPGIEEDLATGPRTVGRIAWAVRAAARQVPKASCLTQGLAGQLLLARHGIRSELCIGVRRSSAGEFAAHAWVEVHGIAVLGGSEAHRFTRMPDLKTLTG